MLFAATVTKMARDRVNRPPDTDARAAPTKAATMDGARGADEKDQADAVSTRCGSTNGFRLLRRWTDVGRAAEILSVVEASAAHVLRDLRVWTERPRAVDPAFRDL